MAAVGTPVEMERSGKQTFCCGAGGAHMWMEERGRGINEERVREAAETGADTLAVACPYCTIMLDDGVRTSGRDLRVADVATLLAESLEDANPVGPGPDGAWPRWFAQPRGLTPMLRGTRLSGAAPTVGHRRAWPRLFYLSFTRKVTPPGFAAGVDLLAVEQRCGLLGDVHVDAALVDHLVAWLQATRRA